MQGLGHFGDLALGFFRELVSVQDGSQVLRQEHAAVGVGQSRDPVDGGVDGEDRANGIEKLEAKEDVACETKKKKQKGAAFGKWGAIFMRVGAYDDGQVLHTGLVMPWR